MPRKYTPKYITNMRNEGQGHPQGKSKWGARLGSTLTVALGLMGAIQFSAWIAPEIQVDPQAVLNVDPLSAPFTVRNSGILPVRDVDADCLINHLSSPHVHLTDTQFTVRRSHIGVLGHNGSDVVYCGTDGAFGFEKGDSADITLTVNYQPLFSLFPHRHEAHRFTTVKESDGMQRWEKRAE